VEAGHRCAIPTCRYIEVDVHHIVPWAQCQTHEYDNLIAICQNCHRRANRGEIDRKSLLLYKINLRFVHDKYSQLEMDILFELAAMPPWNAMAGLSIDFHKEAAGLWLRILSRGSRRDVHWEHQI
jgi:HNH endonuclease